MKKILLLVIVFYCATLMNAQEINCNVQINADQVQLANRNTISTLQKSIADFMNNRRWTDMSFTQAERIECSMNIIIRKLEGDFYSGEIQVQSRRPVYNSGYSSTLLNFKDNAFNFTYQENEQMEVNVNQITSNLTAMLTYYAYLIIGYDFDSYSRLGGTPFFQAAEAVVNMAQSSEMPGWKAFENTRNRYALINNLMDEAFKKFRNYFYEYHRLGLDEMSMNVTNGRARIAAGLPVLREANRARPSAIVISSFLDAKTDELVNVFSKATDKEKKDAVEILSDVNPSQTSRYEQILK